MSSISLRQMSYQEIKKVVSDLETKVKELQGDSDLGRGGYLTKITKRAKCPYCQGTDFFPNESGEFEPDGAYVWMYCEDCKKEFMVHYDFRSVQRGE